MKIEKEEGRTMLARNKQKKSKREKQLLKQQKMLSRKVNAFLTLLTKRFEFKEYVRENVTKGRTEEGKEKAIKAFNAFNGERNISEVEQASGMDHSTLIQAIDQWETAGLLYLHHKEGRSKHYAHLFPIEGPS